MKDKIAIPILFSLSAASSSSWATFLHITTIKLIQDWFWFALKENLTRCRLSTLQGRSSAAACTWWSSRSTWAPTGCPSSPSRCPTHYWGSPEAFWVPLKMTLHLIRLSVELVSLALVDLPQLLLQIRRLNMISIKNKRVSRSTGQFNSPSVWTSWGTPILECRAAHT